MLSQCIRKDKLLQKRKLPEAVEKVKFCKEILTEYENSVRSVEGCSKKTLNGP